MESNTWCPRLTARIILSGSAVAIPRERLQTAAISGLESDEDSGSHALDSHASSPLGIPSGIQMSDAIH
jgi:hypothetical protein